jgi:glycosyltransferase involved in cell wall biosynthesis
MLNQHQKSSGIALLTTVHNRIDTRIRLKQAASLAAKSGEQITLFVQDDQGSEKDEAARVEVVDTGPKTGSRPLRMTIGAWRMWRTVRRARPKVAHFHDPELIPAGLLLKLSGIKVVYDVHEDVPQQILGKFWLPQIFRRPAAWAVEVVEWIAGRCFDAIVSATPKIAERFPSDKTVVVQNFPILQELVVSNPKPYSDREPHFAYVGNITRVRGALEMVAAMSKVTKNRTRLQLAGTFASPDLEAEIEGQPGWKKVDFLGWVSRGQVAELLDSVRAGLVLFHPGPNHGSSQPNKMFEYMATALPVIASDFPLWREIVAGTGCGLLVDPLDPVAIARAMHWILNHPQEAEAMGERGRQAVAEKYNWERESHNLLVLYEKLLKVP